MGSFGMYLEGNKIKVYETCIEPLTLTHDEFLNYMKDSENMEAKRRGLIGLIHEEFDLAIYLYEKLNIPVTKFYKKEYLNEYAKNKKYTYLELLEHIDEYFDLNDDYFYTYTTYFKDYEMIGTKDSQRMYEEFQYNTDERLYKLICKDVELVCNTMFEYFK